MPWRQWREEGCLTVIPGDLIDDEVIEAKLRELCTTYDVNEIGFDPKFAAKLMAKLLDDGLPCVEVPQRPLILGPYYTDLQRAILARRFRHDAHPVLRWCFQNAVPIPGDTGLIFMSKGRSTDAIDCLVAAAMATGRASTGDTSASTYESHDLRVV